MHCELPDLPERLSRYDCRNNRLAVSVLNQIQPAVDSVMTQYGPARVAVVMGTSTSGIAQTEAAVRAVQEQGTADTNYHAVQGVLGGLGEFVASYLQLKGPAYTLSTACSSSANAMLSARRLLNLGICDAVVVGGVDSLCEITIQGFGALEALSAHYCKPFCYERDGINLGEAAAVFVMTREPAEIQFMGGAASSDAHHISAPHPAGEGAYQAMSAALSDAGLRAEDIDYLNLHGTGTEQNDSMESLAVNRLFGEHLPCSSTKAMTGHTLGAGGALELAICYLLLTQPQNWRLPPALYPDDWDQSLPPINLCGEQFAPTDRPRYCLSNSFAFGGSNVSLIIGRSNG